MALRLGGDAALQVGVAHMTGPHHLPAMRIKSHWFKGGGARTPAEQASAAAFIVFRTARRMLDHMRVAHFQIDPGPAYFAFLREVLVFAIAVTDRLAWERLGPEAREAFTVALVRHLARTLQDSEDDLLGPPPPGEPARGDGFIALVDEVSGHYAEFGADPDPPEPALGFHPDFGFVRYLGARLEPTLPEVDRRWVLDQVMATEAPELVAVLRRSMRDLLDPQAPRPRRRGAMTGE